MHERIPIIENLLRNSTEMTLIIPEDFFKMKGEKFDEMKKSYDYLKQDPELEILETSYNDNLEITIKMRQSE